MDEMLHFVSSAGPQEGSTNMSKCACGLIDQHSAIPEEYYVNVALSTTCRNESNRYFYNGTFGIMPHVWSCAVQCYTGQIRFKV